MNYRKTLISIFIIVGLFAGGVAVSQNIKLNPIKPGVKLSAQISDEQQAILAVRKAKAGVVSITGLRVVKGAGDSTPIIDPINGTGWIYSADGLIVSNSHVVEQEDTDYSVVFADGKEYKAKVLGLDKFADVAVLKIELQNLPAEALGDSDGLETGQTVFAIGNSLGRYQNTVTRGVVSGLGRLVNIGSVLDPRPRMQNLIQTDAAINPGNSGGPLVDMSGKVVGMNTVIDRTGEAVGFAVPISVIKKSVDQLLTLGKASYPYAGLVFTPIDKALQLERQLPVSEGAVVEGVKEGGSAEMAGLKLNDIIVEVNREKLSIRNQLDVLFQKYQAGDTILVGFLRNGEKLETPLLLGEYK